MRAMRGRRWARVRGAGAPVNIAFRLFVVAGLGVASTLSAPASAQPLFGSADSLEWMAADATLVARGTLADVVTREEPEWGHWHSVTLRVAETLKGAPQSTLRFVVRALDDGRGEPAERATLDRWKADGRPLLVFLHPSRALAAQGDPAYTRFDFAPRTGYLEGSLLALGGGAGSQVLTMEPRVLSQADETLAAVRAAASRGATAGRVWSHRMTLPPALVRGTPWERYTRTGGGVTLAVPIDARLERRAREWVRSTDPEPRQAGAAALVYFRSDANAALLERLLQDPFSRREVRQARDGFRSERAYPVRRAAHTVLEAWGRTVPKTVLREPVPAGSP